MTTYSYDRENRLISQNVDGNVTSFAYDGFGRKKRESRGVNPDVILNWDGDQMIVESSDLDPEAPSKAYYIADDVIYAENSNLGSKRSRRDYAVDFLGSVTGLVDGDCSLSSARRWSAFGKLLSGSAEPIGYFWTGNTGSRVYQSLGLNDNRARHYGRNIKQWITRDPLWPSELPYAYVNGNPVTRIDPSGSAAKCPHIMPDDLAKSDYAIACSKQTTSSISANLTLPLKCKIGCYDDYINFYLSMSGVEAGFSFSKKKNGWNLFVNTDTEKQKDFPTSARAGDTFKLSLILNQAKKIEFRVDGRLIWTSKNRRSSAPARTVTAIHFSAQRCKPEHSLVKWSAITVDSQGMMSEPWTHGREIVRDKLLSSYVGVTQLDCDTRQFSPDQWGEACRKECERKSGLC